MNAAAVASYTGHRQRDATSVTRTLAALGAVGRDAHGALMTYMVRGRHLSAELLALSLWWKGAKR
jgi:hypothetical protein